VHFRQTKIPYRIYARDIAKGFQCLAYSSKPILQRKSRHDVATPNKGVDEFACPLHLPVWAEAGAKVAADDSAPAKNVLRDRFCRKHVDTSPRIKQCNVIIFYEQCAPLRTCIYSHAQPYWKRFMPFTGCLCNVSAVNIYNVLPFFMGYSRGRKQLWQGTLWETLHFCKPAPKFADLICTCIWKQQKHHGTRFSFM
jgi:hypothetical protein